VVEETAPEVRDRVSEPVYPLSEDREISNPAGAVTVTSPLKVEPDTVKICVEEAVPYVVLNALPKVAGATVIVGEEGAKGVLFTAKLATLSPAVFTA
jgi:hypothetical protein